MATLNFDFHPPSTRPRMPGLVLMLAGLIALGVSLFNLQQTRQTHAARTREIATLEQTLHKRASAPTPPSSRRTTVDATQLAQARVRANLDYSWQPAFAALQSTFNKKIALISLEGSQSKKQLRLVAEARQLADAVAFANRLENQNGVARIALLQHEMQERDAQHPVRFTLLMEMRP